jgi:hypothetical protein
VPNPCFSTTHGVALMCFCSHRFDCGMNKPNWASMVSLKHRPFFPGNTAPPFSPELLKKRLKWQMTLCECPCLNSCPQRSRKSHEGLKIICFNGHTKSGLRTSIFLAKGVNGQPKGAAWPNSTVAEPLWSLGLLFATVCMCPWNAFPHAFMHNSEFKFVLSRRETLMPWFNRCLDRAPRQMQICRRWH